MSTNSQTAGFGNSDQFMELTNSIRNGLPRTYFYAIIGSYLINATMIGFFIFPTLKEIIGYWAALIVASAGTAIIQLFRGLIVFTDLLFAESGENSKLQVKIVALVMTLVGIFELYHLLSGFTETLSSGQIIGIFVFGSSIIVGGWMMEINFIKQTNEYIKQAQGLVQDQLQRQLNLLKKRLEKTEVQRAQIEQQNDSRKKIGISTPLLKEDEGKTGVKHAAANSRKKLEINPDLLKESLDQKDAELRALKQETFHLQQLVETMALEKEVNETHTVTQDEPLLVDFSLKESDNGQDGNFINGRRVS